MTEVESLSENKRALLDRYLRGQVPPAITQSHAMKRRPPGQPVPLSVTQEQLWHRSQQNGIPPLYNEVIIVRRSGALDIPALERSLAEIVRRHEIWRTSYDTLNSAPIQVIHPAPELFTLPLVDLRGLPELKIEEDVMRIATEEAQRPFDLRHGPLLRITLIRTGDADYRLCMVAHLSVVDGVSVYQLFPAELATLYDAFSTGKPSPLEELPIQYGDYAYWQRHCLNEDENAKQLAYWRTQLSGELPVLQWPNDYQRPTVQSYRGAICPFRVNDSLTTALKELTRRDGVTLFTTLMSSFGCLLHCYTGQVRLLIGTPSPAGRKRSEVQKLLGYFLNPVSVLIDLDGDPSASEVLRKVRNAIATAISCDDLPIEILAKELQVKKDPSRNPFFTVAISLQPSTPDVANEWHVTSMDVSSGGAPWDLYLAFIDTMDGMIGRVQYNPDLFKPLTITRMLGDLWFLIETITTDPAQRVSSLATSLANHNT